MAKFLVVHEQVPRRQRVRMRSARPLPRLDWREKAGLFGLVVLVLMAALLAVWSSGQKLSLAYEIREKLNQKDQLVRTRDSLNEEMAELVKPGRLDREALRLGFVKPEPNQNIRVQTNEIQTVSSE